MNIKVLARFPCLWLTDRQRAREEDMRCDTNKLTESVFAVVLFATLGAVAMLALGHELAATEPGLGDIVSFSNVSPNRNPPLVLSAVRPGANDRRICALDTDVMAASGGSLFVEGRSRAPTGGFRVHWAGGPTSAGADDCGANSELVLSTHQLQELAAAAGGFGASRVARTELEAEAPNRVAAE
jgi:hypothetical protein